MTGRTADINNYRSHFPVTGKAVYLNHAAVSPIPNETVEAINRYLADIRDSGMMHETRWLKEIERVRAKVAEMIGALPGEVAFLKSQLYGVQLVAQGLELASGDGIVVADAEFPTNVYPWMSMVPHGVGVKFVGAQEGRINADDVVRAIDPGVKLVAMSLVDFATGCRNGVEEVYAFCRKKGVAFFIDASQAVGAIPFNVRDCGADFVMIGAYKWLFGPQGVFAFYCRDEIEKRVKFTGVSWTKTMHPDEIAFRDGHDRDARRFECDQPNFMGIAGLGGSLDLREKIGNAAIFSRVRSLTGRLMDGLAEKGYTVISPFQKEERSGIVVFTHRSHDMGFLFQSLKKIGVAVNLRNRTIRESPHFYNTRDEIDLLLDAL